MPPFKHTWAAHPCQGHHAGSYLLVSSPACCTLPPGSRMRDQLEQRFDAPTCPCSERPQQTSPPRPAQSQSRPPNSVAVAFLFVAVKKKASLWVFGEGRAAGEVGAETQRRRWVAVEARDGDYSYSLETNGRWRSVTRIRRHACAQTPSNVTWPCLDNSGAHDQ